MLRCMLLILLAMPAAASTPQASAQGFAESSAACRAASGLKGAVVGSAPLLFSDTPGQTVMLVTGRWPQRHMKNAPATMLCLYDRRTRSAEVQAATGWTAPRR